MTFNFTLKSNKIIVAPTIKSKNGIAEFRFILDTGSTKTIIDKSVADIIGFDEYYDGDMLTTAGGRIKSKEIKLKSIKMFDKVVSNFMVGVIDFAPQITIYADGLLGMDFLKKFRHLDIDFENKTIEV
jgi:clan AA aspartic protease (TIGR02281 family)